MNMYLRCINGWLLPCLLLLVAASWCCEEPVLNFEEYLDIVNAQTNSVRPGWYNSLHANEKLPGTEADTIYLYRNGSRCSPTRRHHGQDDYINHLATCPFKHIIDTNNSRLPRRLTHTVCLCEHPRHNSNSHICKSVVIYVKVFRREGCRYVPYWEPVPVACISISLQSVEARLETSSRVLTAE